MRRVQIRTRKTMALLEANVLYVELIRRKEDASDQQLICTLPSCALPQELVHLKNDKHISELSLDVTLGVDITQDLLTGEKQSEVYSRNS